tara:strand:- start:622 stop:906 length:285 start_codon:yes stop_codon:yes gene_type:complete
LILLTQIHQEKNLKSEDFNIILQELLSNGAKMSHVHLIDMLLDSWWTRDHGPWFVNRKLSNGDNEVLVVDHTYNRIQKVEWDEGGCRMYDNHGT